MKSMLQISLVLVIVLLQTFYIASAEEACNEYIDVILRDLKADKEFFQDPFEIPEKAIELHKKILLINYTGEARIYDGHIFGMSTLHRDGDVILDKNKKTHLKLWLGAGELNMQCSGKVKLMGHGPQVKVEATIIYVNMKLDIEPTEKGNNPKIKNFSIEEIKGDEVKVTGLGPLNFFMNSYIKIIGTLFKGLIRNGVEAKLKSFMAEKVKKYEIPEDCINGVHSRSLNFS